MERLLVRGVTFSRFSLVVVGSEEEEEYREGEEFSFAETGEETGNTIIHTFKLLGVFLDSTNKCSNV